jgi:hypothetical protein
MRLKQTSEIFSLLLFEEPCIKKSYLCNFFLKKSMIFILKNYLQLLFRGTTIVMDSYSSSTPFLPFGIMWGGNKSHPNFADTGGFATGFGTPRIL